MGLIGSSGRALAFTVDNRVISGSSPRWGPLLSQLEMITVKCDFNVLPIFHTKEVKKMVLERAGWQMYNVFSSVRH